MLTPWKESYDQPRQHIKKQRHYFTNKGPSSQGYGFSSGCLWMWELDYEEGWALKNWCFWTVVLEKTLESPLDYREIQLVNPKVNQSWIFIGRTDAEAETPIFFHHLILCRPLLLLPSIFPSIRVFSNESALHIRWPKYWSLSFSIIPSKEHPGLTSFRMDWLDLLAVQGTLKSLLQCHSSKASIL